MTISLTTRAGLDAVRAELARLRRSSRLEIDPHPAREPENVLDLGAAITRAVVADPLSGIREGPEIEGQASATRVAA